MGKGLFSLSPQVKRVSLVIHVVWLLTILTLAWINHHYSHEEMEQGALAKARAIHQHDTAYLAWAASLGGIYIPLTAKISPNPYLLHLPDRDLSKPDGTPLTLIVPAHMFRLVNAFKGQTVTRATSLKPLRPENGADAWERAAFARMERDNLAEIFEFTTINKTSFLRYLRHVHTETSCLNCHASGGFQVGDQQGGLAVILPLEELLARHEKSLSVVIVCHLLIYLLGAAGLVWGQGYVTRQGRQRDLAIEALEESESNFRTLADFAFAWEYWLDPAGAMRYVSPSVKELTGYGVDRFMADPDFLKSIIMEDDREILHHHLGLEYRQDRYVIDFRIRTATGEIIWLRHICRPIYDRHGVFQGRRASNYEITEEKRAKLRNEELLGELREALEKVKTLSGFLPICAGCKKIRDDQGYWNQIESYISKHSEAVFSHGICPDCAHRLYPEYYPSDGSGNGPDKADNNE